MPSLLERPQHEAIDQLLQRELDEHGVPGGVLAVVGRDGPVHVQPYGLADVATGRPVDRDTLFQIGSIGKTFTSIVVLQLAGEGRLDLHAPVSDVLPWFDMPVVGRAVTPHDLLGHAAGITAGIDGTPEAAGQVVALHERRPATPPGERFHYSNLGYKILGLVIEALDDQPYPEAVRRRILHPLGMDASEPEIRHEHRARHATGYDYLYDDRIGYPGQPLTPATWIETATADGSIASTGADMGAFARMLLRGGTTDSGRLLDESSFARMIEPVVPNEDGSGYGYGIFVNLRDGRRLIGHPGGMVGYVAALEVDPEAGFGVVVLENGLMGWPLTVVRRVLAVIRGEPVEPATGPVDTRRISGRFSRDPAHPGDLGIDTFEVDTDTDRPVLRIRDETVAVDSFGDDLFYARHPDLNRFAFRLESAERPPAVAWHGSTRFLRDGADPGRLAPPDPSLLALAGHYRSHNPWTTNFRVIVRGDELWLTFASAPDGFDDEQRLVPLPDGSYRAGEDSGGPEDVRFDTAIDGRPVVATLSGWPYYRVGQ